MDLFEAIERRASYRGAFLDNEVSEADIRRIVEAGLRAPSGYNLQTTSFVIVRDAALRAQLAALLPTPAMRTAPVILAAVSNPLRNEGAGAAPLCFAVQDYAAAVEDVTLYSCFDGTEWVLYSGPCAPTATPVYAKAVDRVGNESAGSRLAVQTGEISPYASFL